MQDTTFERKLHDRDSYNRFMSRSSDISGVTDKADLVWTCRTCRLQSAASSLKCHRCGYERTEFDIASPKASIDTGQYVSVRIVQPSFSELAKGYGTGRRAVFAFAFGTVVASVFAIIVLAFLFKSC